MPKMVYDEWYGELTYAQRAAYRKHNVSPSDHRTLVDVFGEKAHAEITAAVKKFAPNGSFSAFAMTQAMQPW